MRSFVSVWTIDTGIPSSNPKVTNRCSSYRTRSSSKVNVAPANTRLVSTKSSPWFFRFRLRLASSHVNRISKCIVGVYIRQGVRICCRLTSQLNGAVRRPFRNAGKTHFDQPLAIFGDCTHIGLRRAANQFVTVAQPTACTATTTDALRLSEATGFEIASADHWLFVRRQVRPPDAKSTVLFNCGASHFGEV